MFRRVMPCILLMVLCAGGVAFAGIETGDRPTLAILRFEEGRIRRWWSPNLDVSEGITQMVTDAVVGKGYFRVVERQRLDELLREQDLGRSGRIDESTAVELGRLLGVRLLVMGTITKFDLTSTGKFSIVPLSLWSSTARVELSGRVIDAQTGEILGSVKGAGEESGVSISIDTFEGISFSASEFTDSILGKAAQAAVDSFVADLIAKVEAMGDRLRYAEAAPKLQGTVFGLIENGVILNIGRNHGVREKAKFRVFRLQRVEGLPEPVRIPVGTVKIISVDANASVALFEGKPIVEPAVGDVVEAEL